MMIKFWGGERVSSGNLVLTVKEFGLCAALLQTRLFHNRTQGRIDPCLRQLIEGALWKRPKTYISASSSSMPRVESPGTTNKRDLSGKVRFYRKGYIERRRTNVS